jgi:hypothetical protein
MLVLTIVANLALEVFYKQLCIFTIFIMLGLNFYQLFLYFKMSGRPYKKEKYYLNVKRFGLVCAIWNLGFIIKFLSAMVGIAVYSLEDNTTTDLFTACLYAMSDFLSMVIPFYAIVDNKFVKIFSFKHLEAGQMDLRLTQSAVLTGLESFENDTGDIGVQLLVDNDV